MFLLDPGQVSIYTHFDYFRPVLYAMHTRLAQDLPLHRSLPNLTAGLL